MQNVPYNLCAGASNSDQVYVNLSTLAERLLAEYRRRFPADDFIIPDDDRYAASEDRLLALLVAGVCIPRYYAAALQFSGTDMFLLRLSLFFKQCAAQSGVLFFRKIHDRIKSRIIAKMHSQPLTGAVTVTGMRRLTAWMYASGEFCEESLLLEKVPALFAADSADCFARQALDFAMFFLGQAEILLGNVLAPLKDYLSGGCSRCAGREDYIFCSRSREEYFLSMIGAQLMSRSFAPVYHTRIHKLVVMPVCLRDTLAKCRAVKGEYGYECAHCSPRCTVSRLTKKYHDRKDISFVTLAHESDSRRIWLSPFIRQSAGIVGVACVLNLISGGLAGKRARVPLQCVILDYAGCRQHWTKDGIMTALNETRLDICLENNQTDGCP